jgi:hypothetical protein
MKMERTWENGNPKNEKSNQKNHMTNKP